MHSGIHKINSPSDAGHSIRLERVKVNEHKICDFKDNKNVFSIITNFSSLYHRNTYTV